MNNILYTANITSEDIVGKLEWLRTHKNPYEEVKEKWDATRHVRIAQLWHGTSGVYNYMSEYGALQLETGYKLVGSQITAYICNNIKIYI